MTATQAPIARRYWFADCDAVKAIDYAVNPPDWGESPVPVTIFCRDAITLVAMERVVGDDDSLIVIDASDDGMFGSIFGAYVAKEQADYVQVTSHAIEDFPASISLIMDQLAEAAPQPVASTLLAVSQFQTEMPVGGGAVPARATWMATSQIRNLLSEASDISPASLIRAIEAEIAELGIKSLPLVTGAFYLTEGEQADFARAESDAELWRARAAVSAAEIDRLQSEKRVRAGREAALRARHDRDLAHQAERSRTEIERLYQAAGWAGRWRARFARIFGRK